MSWPIIVYVAGPYRADTRWGIEQNIRRAEVLCNHLWSLGIPAICPHTNTRFYGENGDHSILDGYKAIALRCDAVLLSEGWEMSTGTLKELNAVRDSGIPIFQELKQLIEWWLIERKNRTHNDAATAPIANQPDKGVA